MHNAEEAMMQVSDPKMHKQTKSQSCLKTFVQSTLF